MYIINGASFEALFGNIDSVQTEVQQSVMAITQRTPIENESEFLAVCTSMR